MLRRLMYRTTFEAREIQALPISENDAGRCAAIDARKLRQIHGLAKAQHQVIYADVVPSISAAVQLGKTVQDTAKHAHRIRC